MNNSDAAQETTPFVVIHSYDDAGTCAFCRKEMKEGVHCSFEGGRFEGFLCRNDFWKFLRLDAPRSNDRAGSFAEKPAPLFDPARSEASA